MKVSELIAELQKYDVDSVVLFPGYEGDWDTISSAIESTAMYCPGNPWYYGRWAARDYYEAAEFDRRSAGSSVVPAVLLKR